MDIGGAIRELRLKRGVTQEGLAGALGVSVQTVSRWENSVNFPDLSMLIRTVETFEPASREEAEEMVLRFKGEKFPVLKDYKITSDGGRVILEVTKEFNSEFDNMRFD